MIEQERLHHHLQNVHQIVVAPDMRELMRQYRFQLLGRESEQRCRGQQDHGTNPTHYARTFGDVMTNRTGRVSPSRAPSRAAIATTGPSAASPERRSTATCLEPQASRIENRTTPKAHAGIAHPPSEASQVGVEATEPVQTAATVWGTVAKNRSVVLDATGCVYTMHAVSTGNATKVASARQLAR